MLARLAKKLGLLGGCLFIAPLSLASPTSDNQQLDSGSLLLESIEHKSEAQQGLLLSTQVKMQVTGMLARVSLVQSFSNTRDEWVNGTYQFPLPTNAAVDHLEMHVGDRVIQGLIKEKEEAKRIFKKASQQGKKASLLQQHRPNIFSAKVANIAPSEQVKVHIEYQQQLEYRDGHFSLRFPMAITPRYQPVILKANDTDEQGFIGDITTLVPSQPLTDKSPQVELSISLQSGVALSKIDSEFHPVLIEQFSSTEYQISLKPDAPTNRDFVLNWWPQIGSEPKAALFTHHFQGHDYGFVMLLPPQPEKAEQTIVREVIFVLDTSGSMSGQSLYQAKQALRYAIENLEPQDSFNLIEFNSQARALWHKAMPASDGFKQEALGFMQALQADGGTEMAKALNQALADNSQAQQSLRQVLFITDGSVGNEAQLMQQIKQHIGDSRLFTIGIGSAPNSYFMQEASNMGRGTYVYIGNASQVQEKLQPLLDKLQRPVVSNLQLTSAEELESYPSTISDLYAGEPLLLSFRAEQLPAELQLTGQTGLQPWSLTLPMVQSAQQSGVEVRWARNKIGSLHREYQLQGRSESVKQAIIDTAMQHHLVSPFTSLVAVEKHVSPPKDALNKSLLVPGASPAGWQGNQGQLPQTATLAPWHIKLGLMLLMVSLSLLYLGRKH